MTWLRCALGAVLLLSFNVVPASAQQGGNSLAGRWQCQMGISGQPQKRLVAVVTQYVLLLYQNGAFTAQGVMRAGVVTNQFQAQGRWGVQRQGQRYFMAAQGQQVLVAQNGFRRQSGFTQYVQVYNLNSMGHRSRLQNGSNMAITCQRR